MATEAGAVIRDGDAVIEPCSRCTWERCQGRPLSVLAIGAHPDDIEIGAGGALLGLAESRPGLEARYVVLTGSAERQVEARQAAQAFFPGRT